VESAVRKLAQERESKRSEHKPTSIDPALNRNTPRRLCAPARCPRSGAFGPSAGLFNRQALVIAAS
jgi:hypothetical protein